MFIKKIETISEDIIMLNPNTIQEFNGREGETLNLHLGLWNKQVKLTFSAELEENMVGVPPGLLDSFTIPEDIDFDWRIENNNLYMGPVIGLVRGTNFSNITKGILRILLRWVKDYKNIKGLVIIFPFSNVEEGAQSVKGYYYNPNSPQNPWVAGNFPFPSSVFFRPIAGLKKKYRILEKLTNKRFFNSNGTGKWEFYSALFNHPTAKKHLPYTVKYQNFAQISKLLNKYRVIYLKRRFGALGYGIIQVKKLENSIEVTRVVKNTQKKNTFKTETELQTFFKGKVRRNRYIIQQGVPFKSNQKHVDFRAYIQKDGSKQWKVRGFIARQAKPNSVVTNLRYTERILPGKQALKELYGFDEEKIKVVSEKIEEACLAAGKSLDMNLGHFGDVALDFVLDSGGHVYFLEGNSNYGHASFEKIKDYQLRDSVFRSPMEYAKSLAGFPTKSN